MLIKSTITNGRLLTGALYVPTGMLLARKRPNILVAIISFLTFFILCTLQTNSICKTLFSAICSISFFCIVEQIKLPDKMIFPFLRQMSTYMYFLHLYVWTVFYMITYGQKTYGMIPFLATLFITCGLSCFYIMIKKKRAKAKDL